MILDLDIYRSANVLVRQYSQGGPIHAAMRAERALLLRLGRKHERIPLAAACFGAFLGTVTLEPLT